MKAYKKDKVISVFRKSLANISITCKQCGITRKTFYEWLKNDAEFAAQITDIKENEVVDFVENALMKRIQDGDTTAIIFACKTLGKKRGYVEKTEHEVSGNAFERLIKNLPDIE